MENPAAKELLEDRLVWALNINYKLDSKKRRRTSTTAFRHGSQTVLPLRAQLLSSLEFESS